MASNQARRRVVVIGGGITGLAAALRLREASSTKVPGLEVVLLESRDRAGGALRTIRRDGFVVEAGADSMLREKPWAIELARRLGLEDQFIPTREEFRTTYVVRKGRLAEIPPGFALLAPARIGPLLGTPLFSLRGKLRVALEPLVPRRRGGGDESLASFVTRRLGREVLDRVAQPLAGGIYTADPEKLSLQATMPRFLEMERRYGSVVRGLRASERSRASTRSTESGARWSLFLSFKAGMQTLAEAVEERLGGCIRCGAEVNQLARVSGRWRIGVSGGDSLEADGVICAAPAHGARRMLEGEAPELAAMLGKIGYASAATVNLAFKRSEVSSLPRTFGFVVPAAERRRIIATSFSSFKFAGRAPADAILARAFLGGVLQDEMMELSDDQMVSVVREEFRDLLGIEAAPSLVEVARWPRWMPQYEVGHLDRVAEIESAAAELPGLVLAGSAYRGVGVPDCVRSGEEAADQILAHLSNA